ncbi:MAG: ATP phosphoribosyltransferase, partial [Actinomyces sp.]
MLRIAVPNKGSLSEPAATMLTEAGYRTRRTGRELVLLDEANEVELFFLRPRDIAVYVGQGTVHAGITGRDLLLDSGVEAVEHLPLGFARSTFRFAAPAGTMRSLDVVEVMSAHDVIMHFPLTPQDRTLNMTPWFHRGGLHSGGPNPTFYVGGSVVPMREFDADTV